MLTSLALAFIAGLVTILNPCVLPLIPILVGSALGTAKAGPLALAAGLVTSFTLFGFTVIAFGMSVAASILAFAYGSRRALGERGRVLQAVSRYARPIFGAALLVVGVMVLTGFDKIVEIALLDALPDSVNAFTTGF